MRLQQVFGHQLAASMWKTYLGRGCIRGAGVRPGWNQKVSVGGGSAGLSGPGETPGGWPPGRERNPEQRRRLALISA